MEYNWLIIDTETTGFIAPIFVVELAAQKMRGWKPDGPSFRRLLNQNADIPSEASRVHGYTREILERDGESAQKVYGEFASYAGNLPLVAYNLPYDLDNVLKPEWNRLGIPQIGSEGFCALRLAQRLLDPVAAGNCKLQTLRQYYRLSERGAHTALGDVQTVADLMDAVLRPLAESRGLTTWDDIVSYARDEWFPSRISFGKYKGRDFHDARSDESLLSWLKWLSNSSNERTAVMGSWYLKQLEAKTVRSPDILITFEPKSDSASQQQADDTVITLYANPRTDDLRRMIDTARTRLADLEASYTSERHSVEVTRSALFKILHGHYQARDRLMLMIKYRRFYLETLLSSGEEDAEQVREEYTVAQDESDADYSKAAQVASEKKELSEAEQTEIKSLWRKLVKLYHPDRYTNDEVKMVIYQKLTAVINQARDEGNMDLLREIATDTNGFLSRNGWDSIDLHDVNEIESLRRLYENLQAKIIDMLSLLDELRESPDYELNQLCGRSQSALQDMAMQLAKEVDAEVEQLKVEAARLKTQIHELTEHEVFGNDFP